MDLKEIQDIVKNVLHDRKLSYTEVISFGGYVDAAININENVFSGVIPYTRWRVVAVGFNVTTNGISTENPEVEFGVFNSDIATTDNDYFGSVLQDITAGDHFAVGDVWIKDPYGLSVAANALANGGTPTWSAGAGKLGTWFTNAGVLKITRPNDHALGVNPFVLIEVKN